MCYILPSVPVVGPVSDLCPVPCSALAADGSRALHLLNRQIRVSPAERRQERAPSARSRTGRARRQDWEPSGPCHADRLPAELLQLVLSQLSLAQLLAVQRVSRRWREAVRELLRRRQQLDLRAELDGVGRLTDRALRHLLRLMPALRVLRTGVSVRTCSYKALDVVGRWPGSTGGRSAPSCSPLMGNCSGQSPTPPQWSGGSCGLM